VRTHVRSLVLTRSWPSALEARRGGGKLTPLQPGCSSCGYGQFSGIPAFRTFCPMCRVRLRQIRQSKLALGRGGA
jgi:hypothetical protein